MPEITCPECGHLATFEAMRRAAEEFCPNCDYPLFWAPSNVPVAVATQGSDATLRRLPGAGGRVVIGTKICPACGEHNVLSATICIRCSSDLDPKEPEPEPEPEPVLLQIPPPPMEATKKRRRWLWILLAIVVVAAVTVAVIAIVH
jgi:ribosomal protein L40E